MRELCLHLAMYESRARAILAILERHANDEELIDVFRKTIDDARDVALEINANWELGIVEKFFTGDEL